MTNAQVLIRNESATEPLSLDVKISEDFSLRTLLRPKGDSLGRDYTDVGDVTTIEQLNSLPAIQSMLNSNPAKISISVVRGTTDIPGAVDFAPASGMSDLQVLNVAFVDGGAGAADTVLGVALPFDAYIVDMLVWVDVLKAAATGTVRTAAAGGGTALSEAFDLSAVGIVRCAGTANTGAMPLVAAGTQLYFRRNDQDAVGRVVIMLQRAP